MRSRVRSALAMGLGAVLVAGVTALGSGMVSGLHGSAGASDSGGSSGISSVPVSFDVVTTNRSGLPCAALPTGRHVTVRGHLTGPSDEVDSDRIDGTLYSHGDGYGEYFWRYQKDEKYNYVDEMARRGHVSVTIDRLGYGDSDKPNGHGVCFGTEADVLHQIVGQLRDGSYSGDKTPRFGRVGLVGHSASGFIVEQEAAGFHDVDALGVLDSGELSISPLALTRAAQQQVRCLLAPNGYAGLEGSDAEFRFDHLHNVEPDIADDLTARRTPDACAGTLNSPQALAGNTLRNSLITAPVLVLTGANDRLFPRPELQTPTYTRSAKVTLNVVPDAGHAIAFARTFPVFHDDMDNWLDANKL
ncbi:MAG TPA: alpha/beta fold hydrolase [Pseudonocardia sp.]